MLSLATTESPLSHKAIMHLLLSSRATKHQLRKVQPPQVRTLWLEKVAARWLKKLTQPRIQTKNKRRRQVQGLHSENPWAQKCLQSQRHHLSCSSNNNSCSNKCYRKAQRHRPQPSGQKSWRRLRTIRTSLAVELYHTKRPPPIKSWSSNNNR